MKIRVVDLETTGTDKQKAEGETVGICEVGLCDILLEDAPQILTPRGMLVNPGFPMPYEARAIHHISDDMLAGATSPDVGCRFLMEGMEPGDVFAAHNMKFERAFFSGGPHSWICSYICAQHALPDAKSHSNQALRYMLGVDESLITKPELADPPHRAAPDAYITASVIVAILKDYTVQDLIRLTTTPVLQKYVGFGKHRGQLWSSMDAGFLQWVLDRDFDDDVKRTARHCLNVIKNTKLAF